MRGMVTGDHESLTDPWSWTERMNNQHARQWADGWQYGTVWRFVPRPADDSVSPAFEPFGPDPLPGGGWELNVSAGQLGVETRSPAQPDVLMQLTYWRRESPGLLPNSPNHKVSRQIP